jgi:hypothetical protein
MTYTEHKGFSYRNKYAMVKIVDELEKKVIEELRNAQPKVEAAFAEVVSGKSFGCWGWTVHISRTPKSQPLPTLEVTPASAEASPSAPASV